MVGVGIGRISGWNINKQIIIEMELREFSYMDNGRKLCFRFNGTGKDFKGTCIEV